MPPPRRSVRDILAHLRWVQALTPAVLVFGAILVAIVPFLVWLVTHSEEWWSPQRVKGRHPDSIDMTSGAIIRRKFFYYVWLKYSDGFDAQELELKTPLLARAKGVVLEIGAGLGHNLKCYEREHVSKIILVEPNASMHSRLEERAGEAGFKVSDGSLQILGCGGSASDEAALRSHGVMTESIDTIVLVHVLCGIPSPQAAIEMYRRLLKPKGQLLFFEHVRSDDKQTAKMQAIYSRGVWRTMFDGCEMNRPTGEWLLGGSAGASAGTGGKVQENGMALQEATRGTDLRARSKSNLEGQGVAGRWASYEVTTPADQNMYTCLPQIIGRCVKP